jgi:hypothetical protein
MAIADAIVAGGVVAFPEGLLAKKPYSLAKVPRPTFDG